MLGVLNCAPTGIRTPVLGLKGLRPGPLDDGGSGRDSTMPLPDGSTLRTSAGWFTLVRGHGDTISGNQPAIAHSGAQSGIDLVKKVSSRNNGWEACVVSEIKELVQFLAHPRLHGLGTQVIQYEQRRGTNFLEAPIVRNHAVGIERRSEVIQHIRHYYENNRKTLTGAVVRDGGCQVGLTSSKGSHEDKPALWFLREIQSGLVCYLQSALIISGKLLSLSKIES